jgi:hypothetical protein
MAKRILFTMTQAQRDALQLRYEHACDSRVEVQKQIDDAWNDLGKAMGFYGDTARCILGDSLSFTAIPMEAPNVDN